MMWPEKESLSYKQRELISAKKYYGKHSRGWVCLINGHPYHFISKSAKKEAEEFCKRS